MIPSTISSPVSAFSRRTFGPFARATALGIMLSVPVVVSEARATVIGGVDLGNLTDYLFVFTDGSTDANWQASSKGYVGDVAINGLAASERTSGTVPYAGTIYTNDSSLGAWQDIVVDNTAPSVASTQAYGQTGEVARLNSLSTSLTSSFAQINALGVTSGYANTNAAALNGLNTTNGIDETVVIDVTSGFQISSQIEITGDQGDVFIFRWDADSNFGNGYDGEVKFQSGGAFVPLGGLSAANFLHVAGDINASGGGGTPNPPFPQGARHDDGTGSLIEGGSDFNGGGYFTGYWLTTGDPSNGETSSMSNAVFVGGWYSSTSKFSMTSGTSGVYVAPNVSATSAEIPAPGSLALFALGLAGLGYARRRRAA